MISLYYLEKLIQKKTEASRFGIFFVNINDKYCIEIDEDNPFIEDLCLDDDNNYSDEVDSDEFKKICKTFYPDDDPLYNI